MTPAGPRVVVAGLGSEYRCDDAAGPLVAARAAQAAGLAEAVGPLGDPLDLLGTWDGADLAIVVDAVRSGRPPGTLRVLELTGAPSGHVTEEAGTATSTHGIGLASVLRLARAIGSAPARVVVVGIEGEAFGLGTTLSPAVAAAVGPAVRRVVELIDEVRTCADGVPPCA